METLTHTALAAALIEKEMSESVMKGQNYFDFCLFAIIVLLAIIFRSITPD